MSKGNIKLRWNRNEEFQEWFAEVAVKDNAGRAGIYRIHAGDRPSYCDRGRFIVHIEAVNVYSSIDWADGFPRYYFSFENMKDEMESWANARKECLA